MDGIEMKLSLLKTGEASYTAFISEPNRRPVTATPSRSFGCGLGKEAYFSSRTNGHP
ncbi:hypothetical protein Hanom_Chr03g00258721 [Helianthus anomalus]